MVLDEGLESYDNNSQVFFLITDFFILKFKI